MCESSDGCLVAQVCCECALIHSSTLWLLPFTLLKHNNINGSGHHTRPRRTSATAPPRMWPQHHMFQVQATDRTSGGCKRETVGGCACAEL